jgi:GTP-binding protein
MISMVAGKAVTYSLHPLQERGELLLVNGDEIYEGMLVGLHSRSNDLCVNPCKPKQLTNVRASGTDESLVLARIQKMTLEQALEFIAEDELVEVTPKSIRLRKKLLTENERKRASKS